MPRKNMDEIPRGVSFLQDALAERLGRPAAIRAPKNDPSQWYLFDPCFSAIQRGIGSSSRDYRSGIHIMDNEIRFYNAHSRSSAKLLRANLLQRPEALLNAAEKTLHLRRHHLLYFSSRSRSRKAVGKSWEDTVRVIESAIWKEFKAQLEKNPRGLVLDMFPELPSAGKIGTGEAVRGSDFCLVLAGYHRIEYAKSDEAAAARAFQVIDAAWHLFACLYPWDSPKRRDASLRRAMLSKPGLLECEYSKIANVSDSECDSLDVQAAHIVPHAHGGSDRYWNGMWLCAKHHRMTEGRVAGSRSRSNPLDLQVRMISPMNDL
jgi:5-methylcytosine-specific restriction endonuclease McrA